MHSQSHRDCTFQEKEQCHDHLDDAIIGFFFPFCELQIIHPCVMTWPAFLEGAVSMTLTVHHSLQVLVGSKWSKLGTTMTFSRLSRRTEDQTYWWLIDVAAGNHSLKLVDGVNTVVQII